MSNIYTKPFALPKLDQTQKSNPTFGATFTGSLLDAPDDRVWARKQDQLQIAKNKLTGVIDPKQAIVQAGVEYEKPLNKQLDTPEIDTSFNGPPPQLKAPLTPTKPQQEGGNDEPSKFSKFVNSDGTKMAIKAIHSIASNVPSLDKNINENDTMAKGLRDTTSSALIQSGNPYAMAAGAAIQIFDKTGGFTDGSQGLGGVNDTLNTMAGFLLPGAGYFVGKTNGIQKNKRVMASSGFGGVVDDVNVASQNANAKLLFGKGKANMMISQANIMQNKAASLLQNQDARIMASANPLYSTKSQVQNQSGSITPNTFMAAKKGAKLYDRSEAQRLLSLRNGGTPKIVNKHVPTFEDFISTLPENLQNSEDYRMKEYWEYNDRPETFQQALEKGMFELSDDGTYHAKSIAWNPNTGEGEFMKYSTHPTNWMEEWYYKGYIPYPKDPTIIESTNEDDYWPVPIIGDDKIQWEDFISKYDLDKSGDYWKYVPKENNEITSFKKGGSFNVIPVGALHKNKHHLSDIDDKFNSVTTKGIPVITESEGGKVTQHAEVEKEEWTIRLEVTEKIEDLLKSYEESDKQSEKDKFAIEAGELVVEELLFNTQDQSGLINKIE